MLTGQTHPTLALCLLLGLAVGLPACGPDGDTSRTIPDSPVIDSVDGASETVAPGSTTGLTVVAHLSGSSGGVADAGTSGGLSDGLTASWTVDGEGWTIGETGESVDLTAPDSYGSEATIEVVVTSQEGQSDSAEVTVTTGENESPAITGLTATPNPADPGSDVALSVEASDANGDSLTYAWSGPDGWSIADAAAAETTVTTPDEGGTFANLTVTVTDGYGGEASSRIRVDLRQNAAPSISSVTATPPQVAPGGTIELEALASDPEQGELTYSWQLPQGWMADQTSGSTITLTAPSSYDQTATARVTVTDPKGATAEGSVTVSTRENDGPIIAALDANPKSVAGGGTIALNVDASDPNGDSLSYSWSVDDPMAWSLTPNGKKAELQSPQTPGASTSVSVEVADAEGKTATASVVVSTAPNTAPTLSSVSANPQTIAPGGTTTVSASANDADGDTLSYSWTVPMGWSTSGSGDTITVTAPSSYGASGVVRVTVDDGNGATAKGSALVATEKNQAPLVTALTANPQTVAPSGTVTVEATATDPNGDTLNYSWTVPAGWSKSGTGSKITLTAPGSYGQSGIVQLTVDDGNGASASQSVLVETARNQSPMIASLTAQPVILAGGSSTTVTVDASDPDGDPLSYSWSVPMGWTKMGSGKQISVQAPNQAGVSATIKVTVVDGNGGQSQSAVVVQTTPNNPPKVDALSASPNPVLQNSETTVTVSASDIDGDSLSYSWSVSNNNWSQTGSGASVSVESPNTANSSTDVTVTVDDGKGGTATDTVTVSTSACASGTGNCDGQSSNSCEIDLNTDESHCGACGQTCGNSEICLSGTCKSSSNVAYQCSGNTGYVVFAQNVGNRSISSYQDVVDACKAYGFKALGTTYSSHRADKGWGDANNSNMHLAIDCYNCYSDDDGYPWYYHRNASGNGCSHVSGQAQKDAVMATFVANAGRTNLNCVTFDQTVDASTAFGSFESDDAESPWYYAEQNPLVDNDPNCDRNNDTADATPYSGTPEYVLCASATQP